MYVKVNMKEQNKVFQNTVHEFSYINVFSPTKIIVINTDDIKKPQQKFQQCLVFKLFCTLLYLWWWWSCLFSFCCRSQAIDNQTSEATTTMMITAATSAINSKKWSTRPTLLPSTQSISNTDDDKVMIKSTVISQHSLWYLNKNNTRKQQKTNR